MGKSLDRPNGICENFNSEHLVTKRSGYLYEDPVTGKVWKKVLYEKNPFPDNYTPEECFLAAIEKNKNLTKYTFKECLGGACQVALQISAVFFFAVVYSFLSFGLTRSKTVLLSVIGTSFAGYLVFELFLSRMKRNLKENVKHVLIFTSIGLGLAPVLYKLTDTISTDTIYTMTSLMLFVHLAFHDYGLQVAVVSRALSINASLFAAVCLASRLASSFDAFVLLSLAVELFVLFPLIRTHLRSTFLFVITITACLSSIFLIASLSVSLAILATVMFIVILLLCPMLFVHYESYKEIIHGPWDEAVPSIN